ncbi:MAG: VWA domain-containing protein, partial [Chloroflexia bacterium]|nr:VWA domain-containing protein [Chloroflexia bacterium]
MIPLLPDLLFTRGALLWALLLVPIVVLLPARFGTAAVRPAARWLRGAVLLLLIITLAGPLAATGTAEATTVFVVDRSHSVGPGASDSINRWVAETLGAAGTGEQAAVVTFGADPTLAAPAQPATTIDDGWQSVTAGDPNREVTDLASALALSRSLPVGEGRRIVLLSDGAENAGRAIEQANQAAAEGVPIDVLPVPSAGDGDLRVEAVTGPSAVWSGDDLTVLANLATGAGGEVTLELVVDGVVAHRQAVTLQPGASAYSLTAPKLPPGFHAVEVRVAGTPELDRVAQNNQAALAVVVRDEPRLLLVVPEGADSTRLHTAFTSGGAAVTVVLPAAVPLRLSELSAYDSIVLDNVPAWTLSTDQQRALVERTRAGGSLIVVGGAASYGPGGYAGTPLESALPVTVKVTDGTQRPRVALLLVIDKSGSMSYDPGGGTVSKIDMAREAVRQAAAALAPGDQVGVIAFNDEPRWLLTMTTLEGEGDSERTNGAVAQLTADGGTELYPAMQVGYDAMRNVPADVRHIVLISDGKSQSGSTESYQRLVSDVGNDNITLSTIAIGDDADTELLQSLATAGHGRYHQAVIAEDIPRLTLEEARSAGSQSVLRGAFQPVQQTASPILSGIPPQELPPLEGYDFAESRPDAQTVLTSDRGDPVLATWQLGLGRVVAWTADGGGDFAAQWEAWPRYDEFWGNALRWSLPDPTNSAVRFAAERRGADVVVTLDAVTANGDTIDLSGATVAITAPDGTLVTEQTPVSAAPGRSEVRLPSLAAGAY